MTSLIPIGSYDIDFYFFMDNKFVYCYLKYIYLTIYIKMIKIFIKINFEICYKFNHIKSDTI
jgi:hypothetical protein